MATTVQHQQSSNGAASTSRFDKPASRITEEYEKGPDVWSVFNPLNFPHATNLGQGFMSFPPPSVVREELSHMAMERISEVSSTSLKARMYLLRMVSFLRSERRKRHWTSNQKSSSQPVPMAECTVLSLLSSSPGTK
jgi:hypothetical protein